MALGLFYTPTEEDRQRLFTALKGAGLRVTKLDIEEEDAWPRCDGWPIRQKLVAHYTSDRSVTQVKARTLRALRRAKLQMAEWVYLTQPGEYVLTVKGET